MERVRIKGMQDPKLEVKPEDPNKVFDMEVATILQDLGVGHGVITEASGKIFSAVRRRDIAIGDRIRLQRPGFPEEDLPNGQHPIIDGDQ